MESQMDKQTEHDMETGWYHAESGLGRLLPKGS